MAKTKYGIGKTLAGIERIVKRASARITRATMAVPIKPGRPEIPVYLTIRFPMKGALKK
jgi:hypothetical protein